LRNLRFEDIKFMDGKNIYTNGKLVVDEVQSSHLALSVTFCYSHSFRV
jgi:hypothetical protein